MHHDSQAQVLLGPNHVSDPFLELWTPESENYRFWSKHDALAIFSLQKNTLTMGADQINPQKLCGWKARQ